MGIKIQTIRDIRSYLSGELAELYPEEEIRALTGIVLNNVLRMSSIHQVLFPDKKITRSQSVRIIEICSELKAGKPVQYVLGETLFYGCIIKLDRSTLIPRPETEELTDLIIRENKGYPGNIIDIGTGSGCIAITLAANFPAARLTATDISYEALSVAAENARRNRVTVRFLHNNILDPIAVPDVTAGIIVSNPPYVRNSEKSLMKRNVLDFEPHSALFVDDSDPLVFYRAILEKAKKILLPAGRVYFEINEAMGSQMVRLLGSSGYSEVTLIKDINGKDRIIKAIKND